MKIFTILTIGITSVSVMGWVYSSGLLAQQKSTSPGIKIAQADDTGKQPNVKKAGPAQPNGDTSKEKPDEPKTPEPIKADPKAVATLKESRDNLVKFSSIKAKIVEQVAIGSRRFKVTGSYLQGGELRLRLEYQIQLGKSKDAMTGSVLQVCDGQVLWTRHKIGKEARITRRDVKQILSAADNGGAVEQNVLIVELGLGGVPSLLASLEHTMVFTSQEEQKIDGKLFTVIEGAWNEIYRKHWESLAGEDKRYPEHVPEKVRVYFDHDHKFPRRILYLKKHPTKDVFRPMVTLDFIEITVNAEVDETQFHFVPDDKVFQEDVTNQYLQLLKSIPPRKTEEKKDGKNKDSEDNGKKTTVEVEKPTKNKKPKSQP